MQFTVHPKTPLEYIGESTLFLLCNLFIYRAVHPPHRQPLHHWVLEGERERTSTLASRGRKASTKQDVSEWNGVGHQTTGERWMFAGEMAENESKKDFKAETKVETGPDKSKTCG